MPEGGRTPRGALYGGLRLPTIAGAVLFLILRLQNLLPLNPQGFPGTAPDLAFNTAVSFMTNTDWQSYVPEATLSTFSQMAGLTTQNFASAAAAIAVAAAVARAFALNRGEGLGNFWVDLTRISLYILLPFSILLALIYVALGEPQTLAASAVAHTVEGAKQTIALYPTASQEAIKQLGTNGGGIFNANSAHPFENPTSLTNLIELISMNMLCYACVVAFGIIAFAKKEARAAVLPVALKGLENGGPHGLSEILYAYASAAATNGSAFAGLTANTPYWNSTLAIAILLGRFAYIAPVLAMAGSIAAKPKLQPTAGTLPSHGPLFVGLMICLIIILAGLEFFPALALGPILEHFQMLQAIAGR